MRIDAVAVTAKDIKKSVAFYTALGFAFAQVADGEDHVEAKSEENGVRLMIDSVAMITDILGKKPQPANHSPFALLYDSPDEVDLAAKKAQQAGGKIIKAPWDAFWGQRYAVVADPDGYLVDLFAYLKK